VKYYGVRKVQNKNEVSKNCQLFVRLKQEERGLRDRLHSLQKDIEGVGKKFNDLEVPEHFCFKDNDGKVYGFTLDMEDGNGVIDLETFQDHFSA
jgi:hypothetical protein